MNKTTVAEQVRSGHSIIVNTRGVSMNPLLYEGKTQVLIEPLKEELKLYDLPIYYLKKNTYVIHRLIKMDEKYYYTRGDNCLSYERVPKENVFGVVTKIYKGDQVILMDDPEYLRYVNRLVKTTPLRLTYFKFRSYYVRVKAIIKRIIRGKQHE